MKKNKKRVLVAALDWGLGHATRSVQVIRQLQSEGCEVILASAGSAADFYRSYFPELPLIEKPAYRIRYYRRLPFAVSMFIQSPSIIITIIREHFWLRKTVISKKITDVISDNCYGLWNKDVNTIFITHQLRILCNRPLKFVEPFLQFIVSYFVNKFDECHVPDLPNERNLSGKLSHSEPIPSNVKFTGPMSRFSGIQSTSFGEQFDIVFLLSGPEPQRTLFEDKCVKILKGRNVKASIVRGIPGTEKTEVRENITLFNHLPDETLASILKNARKIVCRSGYSTLMDLHVLKLNALLIPTPGQTEQEYLAEYHSAKGQFENIRQDELTFEKIIESSELYQAL